MKTNTITKKDQKKRFTNAKPIKLSKPVICPCCLDWKQDFIGCDCGLILCADCRLMINAAGYCPDCFIRRINEDLANQAEADHSGAYDAQI